MKDLALWSPGSSQPARLNHTRNIQACFFFFDKYCSWPVRTFGILNWEAQLFSDHRAARLIRNLLWHMYSKFPFSSYFLSQAASPFLFVLFPDWGTACADSAGRHYQAAITVFCQWRIVFFINQQMISCILAVELFNTHSCFQITSECVLALSCWSKKALPRRTFPNNRICWIKSWSDHRTTFAPQLLFRSNTSLTLKRACTLLFE